MEIKPLREQDKFVFLVFFTNKIKTTHNVLFQANPVFVFSIKEE